MLWSISVSISSFDHFTEVLLIRSVFQSLLFYTMNKMKNFKRRFSLSVPRTETIEENEFTEQINQLNIRHTQGKNSNPLQSSSLCPNLFILLLS